jgi:hypothetical protein
MFYKVRFITRDGRHATAGLVFPAGEVIDRDASYLSRFFPMSEALKMQLLQISPMFPTMDEALAHTF